MQTHINERQKEFRMGEEVEQTASVLTQFTSEDVQSISFKLALKFEGIDIKLFKEDFNLMNEHNFDASSAVWCSLRANSIGLNLSIRPFDNSLSLSIDQAYLSERDRLNREVLLIDQPSLIIYKAWSLNAPTIGDSECCVSVTLGSNPILLYDPVFINEITKYLRNLSD